MSVAIPAQLRSEVRRLDKNRCAYCQAPEELAVTTFDVDHIAPVSAGGATTVDNLCLACPACNRHKGARQSAPDPQTGQSAPLYHPRCQDWSAHFEWSEDKSLVVGLTPIGRATIEALRMNRSQIVRLRRLWAKMSGW